MTDLHESERLKYEQAWGEDFKRYRKVVSGMRCIDEAYELMGMKPGDTLIDWGCGTGRCAQWFQDKGLIVTGFDIAANCLDSKVNIPLVVGTMWDPDPALRSDWAYCTDALEHIPEEKILDVLDILRERTSKGAYLQVDTVLDVSGPRMDPPQRLHLTVKNADWWTNMLKDRWGTVIRCPAAYSRAGYICEP